MNPWLVHVKCQWACNNCGINAVQNNEFNQHSYKHNTHHLRNTEAAWGISAGKTFGISSLTNTSLFWLLYRCRKSYSKGQKCSEIFLERLKLFRNVEICMYPQSRYFKILSIRFTVKDPSHGTGTEMRSIMLICKCDPIFENQS